MADTDLIKRKFDMISCGKLKDRDIVKSNSTGVAQTELTKRKFDMVGCGKLKDRVQQYSQKAEATQKSLNKNPFSDNWQRPELKTTDEGYGRPESGTLTEIRGIQAGNHVGKEIVDVCDVIDQCGIERPDGLKIITFGQIFRLYTRISDKVVGMLLRARKYGLVDFDGEMLYQRQDDDKIITLLKPMSDIRQSFKESGDPANCLKMSAKKS